MKIHRSERVREKQRREGRENGWHSFYLFRSLSLNSLPFSLCLPPFVYLSLYISLSLSLSTSLSLPLSLSLSLPFSLSPCPPLYLSFSLSLLQCKPIMGHGF